MEKPKNGMPKKDSHWFYGDTGELDVEALNLVEFPLALLSMKVPTDEKVLTFQDRIFDRANGELIERSVRISANVDSNLPNYFDQDVFVALNCLAWRKNRFREETVEFSLYELVKLMGLDSGHKSYKRLAESLDNWLGLKFKFSHWRVGNSWTNPKATVLLQDYDLTRKGLGNARPKEVQTFSWSRLYLQTMQAAEGRKPFDSEFYFSLKKPISRRLFRFLDKRLFGRPSYDYALVEFCTEKLGASRNYRKPADYRNKLKVGYDELVSRGFLRDLPEDKRYPTTNGERRVHFCRGSGQKSSCVTSIKKRAPKRVKQEEPSRVAELLIARGVSSSVASKLASEKATESERQVEYFDFKVASGWKPESSAGGYLVRAIEGEFVEPTGYTSKAEREAKRKALAESQRREEARKAREEEHRKKQEQSEALKVREYLAALPSDEVRKRFEEEALSKSEFARTHYVRAKKNGHDAQVYLDIALKALVSAKLKEVKCD